MRRSASGADHRRKLPTAGFPIGVAAGLFFDVSVPLHHQQASDHLVEEVAIVADQNNRAFELQQDFFEQFQRLDIEIISRFIEDEQIGGPGE